jgi:poly(hydroxyalkanoate) depolymerase family esterase
MENGKSGHVAEFFRGITYPVTSDQEGRPVTKADLITYATEHGADERVLATLERLPDKAFKGPFSLSTAMSTAIGEIGREERAFAEPPEAQGTWKKDTYRSKTDSREYFVYTPINYKPGSAVPLLVMLHGCIQGPEDFAAVTQMNQLADQKQFIVVYPRQACGDNLEECWNWFEPSNQSRDSGEPAILAGITQEVQRNTDHWTIDPSRVYVAGLSAGGAMSVILGAIYPDIFAAIGVHSGAEYKAAANALEAWLAMLGLGGPDPMQQGQLAYHAMGSHARVVPTIVFHGTNDHTMQPVNGHQVVRQWMETDRLASHGAYPAAFHKPSSTMHGQVPGGRSYTAYTWHDSSGNVVQAYWTVDGMDHAWSGGSAGQPFSDPQGPNASLAMYQFFLAHPATATTAVTTTAAATPALACAQATDALARPLV